jgi:hypothetical protein
LLHFWQTAPQGNGHYHHIAQRGGRQPAGHLDVQDNMIKQVKVLPVTPLRESVAE